MEGVGHVWLLDPVVETLEVYRLTDGQWTLVGTWEAGATVRAEPFDAVALDLARRWAR